MTEQEAQAFVERFAAAWAAKDGAAFLRLWHPERRREFIDQIQCTNTQALRLLDRLGRTDPDALVIVQADHGSAFLQPFAQPVHRWTREQVVERFSILSAIKLPSPCEGMEVPDDLTSVNTFRIVFACLTGVAEELVPTRHFVAPSAKT